MRNIKFFFPLFLSYIIIILAFPPKTSLGDETRYIRYAEHLSHGYYEEDDSVLLTNPPVYPLVLTPFIYFGVPLIYAKLLNAFFMLGALFFFFKALNLYFDKKKSLLFSYVLGVYPGALLYLTELYTEIISIFFICGFIYFFSNLFQKKYRNNEIILASLFLTLLILTKVVFAYVLLIVLFILFLKYLFNRNKKLTISILVLSLSFSFCLPYLAYTYTLTGKILYWSSNGGDTLYWMTTPYKNEFGDWFTFDEVQSSPQLRRNHGLVADKVGKLTALEKDQYLRNKSISNIEKYPLKFLFNWTANIGRLFFNYPYSYLSQRMTSYFYIFPNMFLVVFLIISVYLNIIRWKLLPFELKILLLFIIIYLGISSILSAVFRYILVIIPPLILWIVFTLKKMLTIRVQKENLSELYD